jgi:hypothetical protein
MGPAPANPKSSIRRPRKGPETSFLPCFSLSSAPSVMMKTLLLEKLFKTCRARYSSVAQRIEILTCNRVHCGFWLSRALIYLRSRGFYNSFWV